MTETGGFQNQVQSVETRLDNGTHVCLRRIRHSDLGEIEKGISQLSDQSRYLRFFSGSKTMPPSVVERLATVDGIKHLAWGLINIDEKILPPLLPHMFFGKRQPAITANLPSPCLTNIMALASRGC